MNILQKTGKDMVVSGWKVVSFKCSGKLKDRINGKSQIIGKMKSRFNNFLYLFPCLPIPLQLATDIVRIGILDFCFSPNKDQYKIIPYINKVGNHSILFVTLDEN